MKNKNKWIYIVLALLFGGFGIHKLYEGMPFKFVFYLIFSWTLVPAFIAAGEAGLALLFWE